MIKKLIPVFLALCMIFGMAVMAENSNEAVQEATQEMPQSEAVPQMGGMQGRGMPQSMPDGEMPSGDFTPPQGDFAPPEGFTPPEGEFSPPRNSEEAMTQQENDAGNSTETTAPQAEAGVTDEKPQAAESAEEQNQTMGESSPFGGQRPGGMGGFSGNMQSGQNNESVQQTGFAGFVKTYATPLTAVVLLFFAYIFVIFYKRKKY